MTFGVITNGFPEEFSCKGREGSCTKSKWYLPTSKTSYFVTYSHFDYYEDGCLIKKAVQQISNSTNTNKDITGTKKKKTQKREVVYDF